MINIVRKGQRTTGIFLTQKQRAQYQKQSEKNGAKPARNMAVYNEDDYCVAQGGGRYNAKRLGMMYLPIKTWALLYVFGAILSMLLTNRLIVT